MRRWLLVPVVSLTPMVAASTVYAATLKPAVETGCAFNSLNRDRTQVPDRKTSLDSDHDSLTDVLDSCNSVLKPPPVNDPELTIRPPVTGETPVIPPRALPEQPPQGG